MRPCIFLHAKMCNGKFAHAYMQNCTGDETSAERQSSLAFIVEEEKRCTTVYFFLLDCVFVYLVMSVLFMCVLMFSCGGTVYWNNFFRVQTYICMRIPFVCPASLYWHFLHTCSKLHASDVFVETGEKTSHDDGSEALSALLRTA